MKQLLWVGSALTDLRAFPEDVRRFAGLELRRIQAGLNASDWKPMSSIGPGVREIRIRSTDGSYRVIYVSKLADAIHVLHAFAKTSQKTSKPDLELARQRLKSVLRQLN